MQRCVIHQIRHSLRYVTWADQKEFMRDLKTVYRAPTREAGEMNCSHWRKSGRALPGRHPLLGDQLG